VGKSTLIKARLSSTVIYHMSMFLLPKTSIERMEKIRRFFWQRGKMKKNYHLVKRGKIVNPKGKEGCVSKI
jgi:hypothetical protein